MVPYREVCKEVWKKAEKLKIALFFTKSESPLSRYALCHFISLTTFSQEPINTIRGVFVCVCVFFVYRVLIVFASPNPVFPTAS